ncbi:hypothetical protein [Candidatus Uabimicrobium sp. HlEnr_7]|uniref:hypothetical protein n=1 Tax=Candidatus Uabimicrobium helgolandensis TaxID=3095367 RepID=UPI0035586A44
MNIEQLRKKRKEFIAKEDWDGALEVINQSIKIETTASRLCVRGSILVRLGRLDEALESYLSAQKLKPTNKDAASGIENIDSMLKNNEKAEKTLLLQKLRKKREHFASQNKWPEVVIVLDKMIAIEPLSGRFVNRGNTLLLLNKYEAATKSFATALKLDPKSKGAKQGIEKINGLKQKQKFVQQTTVTTILLLCILLVVVLSNNVSVQTQNQTSVLDQKIQLSEKTNKSLQKDSEKNQEVATIEKQIEYLQQESQQVKQNLSKLTSAISKTSLEKKTSPIEKEFEETLTNYLKSYVSYKEDDLAIKTVEQITKQDQEIDLIVKILTSTGQQGSSTIKKALKNSNSLVRKIAIETAVNIGPKFVKVVPTLRQTFSEEKNTSLKKEIGKALVMIDKTAFSVPEIKDFLEEKAFAETVANFEQEDKAKQELQQATKKVYDAEEQLSQRHKKHKEAALLKAEAEKKTTKNWEALDFKITQVISELKEKLNEITNQKNLAVVEHKNAQQTLSREKEYLVVTEKRVKIAKSSKSLKNNIRHSTKRNRKKTQELLELAFKTEKKAIAQRQKAKRELSKGKGSEEEKNLKAALNAAKSQEQLAIKERKLVNDKLDFLKKEVYEHDKEYHIAYDLLIQEEKAYEKALVLIEKATKNVELKKKELNSIQQEKATLTEELTIKTTEKQNIPIEKKAAEKHFLACKKKERICMNKYISAKEKLATAKRTEEIATRQRTLFAKRANKMWIAIQKIRQSRAKQ